MTQPTLAARVLVVTNALDTNASPTGWIDDGANKTRGNNLEAHADLPGDDAVALRPQGNLNWVFGCDWHP